MKQVEEYDTSSEGEEMAAPLRVVEEVEYVKSVYQPPIQVLMMDWM